MTSSWTISARPDGPATSSTLRSLLAPFLLQVFVGISFALQDSSTVPAWIIPLTGIVGAVFVGAFTRRTWDVKFFSWAFGGYMAFAQIAPMIDYYFLGTQFSFVDSRLFYNIARGAFGPVKFDTFIWFHGSLILDNSLGPYLQYQYLTMVRQWQPTVGLWPVQAISSIVCATIPTLTAATVRQCIRGLDKPAQISALLCAFNPAIIFYAAEPLRDNFAALDTIVLLYAFTRLAREPGGWSTVTMVPLIALASYFMLYIRLEFLFIPAAMFGSFLVASALYSRRTKSLTIIVGGAGVVLPLAILVIAGPTLFAMATGADAFRTTYQNLFESQNQSQTSLGLTYLVLLPLPLRILASFLALSINPIPLWANFVNAPSTAWLWSLNGFWFVALIPPALTGALSVIPRWSAQWINRSSVTIVIITYVIAVVVIGITTLSFRHMSAFIPLLSVLAVVPMAIGQPIKPLLFSISRGWFGLVVAIHILWAVAKIATG